MEFDAPTAPPVPAPDTDQILPMASSAKHLEWQNIQVGGSLSQYSARAFFCFINTLLVFIIPQPFSSCSSIFCPMFHIRTDVAYHTHTHTHGHNTFHHSFPPKKQATFVNWINDKLGSGKNSTGLRVERLNTDLSDGVVLLKLLENLTGAKFPKYNAAPKLAAHSLVNLDIAFQYLREEGVKLVSIGERCVAKTVFARRSCKPSHLTTQEVRMSSMAT